LTSAVVRRGLWSALAFAAAAPVAAQSPLVGELQVLATQYHHDPGRLDRVRDGLEQALRTDSHVANLIALAQVSFIWGDIRARSREEKLEAYDRGRRAGQRAVELAPRDPSAHFWYAINTARWGQVNGVVRSLFLLPTVRKELDTVLELDPKFTGAYIVSGNVFYEVPALLGGDLEKAEEMFRKALKLDARFTAARVGLAKTLLKTGRLAEGRRELQAVLAEKKPRNPADWTLKDSRDARELLAAIREGS
jgi:tetratricopeptide (TPR) repeat protein